MNARSRVILAASITPNAVRVKESGSGSPITVRMRMGSYGTCASLASARMNDSLESGNRRAAEAFPDNPR